MYEVKPTKSKTIGARMTDSILDQEVCALCLVNFREPLFIYSPATHLEPAILTQFSCFLRSANSSQVEEVACLSVLTAV